MISLSAGPLKDGSWLTTRTAQRKGPPPQRDYLVPEGAGFVRDLARGSLRLETVPCGTNSEHAEAGGATAGHGAPWREGKMHAGGKRYPLPEGELEAVASDVSRLVAQGNRLYLDSAVSHIRRNPGEVRTKTLVLTSLPSLPGETTPVHSGPCRVRPRMREGKVDWQVAFPSQCTEVRYCR
jgi:hypothetical protein